MAKKQKKAVQLQLTPEGYIKTRARSLAIDRCFVNSDWQEQGMANVIVVRRHPKGTFTVGGYLVDTFCLGVKNCLYSFSIDEEMLEETLLRPAKLAYGNYWQEVDYTTAHNIVYGALEYARDLGFNPHEDWAIAKYILEEDDDDVPLIEFEFGKNGRPLLCAKSNLEASLYMTILNKSVGRGNYDVIIKDDEGFDEDDSYDDLYEEVETTQYILDSVQDMTVHQEELYHSITVENARRSQDVSKEMRAYAELLNKEHTTLTDFHNAHVDAVISIEKIVHDYDSGVNVGGDKMALCMAFTVCASILCEQIEPLTDQEAREIMSSEEKFHEFFNKCDKAFDKKAEEMKALMK